MEPTFVPEVARRFTMALLFITHIQFAAFFIGLFTLAVVAEFFLIVSPEHTCLERAARGLGKVAAIGYSTGAVLAFSVILFGASYWPIFWNIILRATFWPFFLEGITFVLTILYLFPWFFAWESLSGSLRWVHLSLGAALVISAYAQQTLIDVVASYMLTPATTPIFLRAFFNPTAVPLDAHRIVGDISFAGFVVAGYAAFRTLRARNDKDRAFYDWLGSIALLAGLGFLIFQPAIGIEYAMEIRMHAPGAFNTMFRGSNSWLFLLQVLFLSVLFFLSMLFIIFQVRKSGRPGLRSLWALSIVAGVAALLLINPYVIGPSQQQLWINWVNPVGSMQPWKYIAFAGLTIAAFGAVMIFVEAIRTGMQWGRMDRGGKWAQVLLLLLAVFASFMMALMGYIRENSRLPYLIYYNQYLEQPERFPDLQPTPTSSMPDPAAGPPQGLDLERE